jgi:hypothetical protein
MTEEAATQEDPLNVLAILNLVLLYTNDVSEKEATYVFDCLKSSSPLVAQAAATVLAEMPKAHIMATLNKLDTFSNATQKIIIIFASTTNYTDVFVFLLNRFEALEDKDWIYFMTICLSKTHFFIYPLLMPRLYTETPSLRDKYHRLFSKMSFTRLEPYLAMLPSIPHERFFRTVYGNRRIDRLKA